MLEAVPNLLTADKLIFLRYLVFVAGHGQDKRIYHIRGMQRILAEMVKPDTPDNDVN